MSARVIDGTIGREATILLKHGARNWRFGITWKLRAEPEVEVLTSGCPAFVKRRAQRWAATHPYKRPAPPIEIVEVEEEPEEVVETEPEEPGAGEPEEVVEVEEPETPEPAATEPEPPAEPETSEEPPAESTAPETPPAATEPATEPEPPAPEKVEEPEPAAKEPAAKEAAPTTAICPVCTTPVRLTTKGKMYVHEFDGEKCGGSGQKP